MILSRSNTIKKMLNFYPTSRLFGYAASLSLFIHHENGPERLSHCDDENKVIPTKMGSSGFGLSPLFADDRSNLRDCRIELVDPETWEISSGLVEAWRKRDGQSKANDASLEARTNVAEDDSDCDKIDDMRVRGNLFYKIDRDSKEYEEYSFDFHRKKNSDRKNKGEKSKEKKSSNAKLGRGVGQKEERKEIKKKEMPSNKFDFKIEDLDLSNYQMGNFGIEKKVRTPTFNQLRAAYHEPFCLDIYISKGSVRACIIHRASSKVVAVAHSISKDMKFDYSSKTNATTCAAVGEILAQRALADDVHNVVYTPRKGDKIEGKLQIVLQSIIDNGVNVKIKLKQRKLKKVGHLPYCQK